MDNREIDRERCNFASDENFDEWNYFFLLKKKGRK